MSFGSPALLATLLLVPAAVAAIVALDRLRRRRAEAWAPATLLPNMVARPSRLHRILPTALLLAGLTLLLVGFARPRATLDVSAQEATVVLVLDVSGSMAATDTPPSRAIAAKAIANRFLDELPHGYRASLVTFSDHAAVAAAPTQNLDRVRAALARAKTGPQGTALADGVVQAVRVANAVKGKTKGRRPPAVVIVLSDGGQTAGRVTPRQAAIRARQARIPVSTILLGTPDGVVQQKLKGGFTERIAVAAQPQALDGIARASGGHFMSGPAAVDVKGVYEELGSRVGTRRKTIEVSAAAAAGGLVFMLAGGVLSGAWWRRVPA